MNQKEWSKAYDKHRAKQESKQELKFYNKFQLHSLDRNIKILDIGCGRGDFVKLINKQGFNAIGIDTSDLVFDKSLKGKLFIGDACNIPFPNNSFDLVVISMVLHHLHNDNEMKTCLKEIKRVLNKEGLLCFREPANTLCRNFANFMLFTPIAYLFKYSRYLRKIHEEEWPEYSRWMKNQDKTIELIKKEFNIINFEKDLLNMYIQAKPL